MPIIFFLIVTFAYLFPMMANATDRRPGRAPSRRRWGGFVHLLARRYQNYQVALMKAARRRRKHRRAVDIDVQVSREGTLWALHWPTVGRNKLHDPRHHIGKKRRIDSLSDRQIAGLRGPRGQKPDRLGPLLVLASHRGVRVEAEAKVRVDRRQVEVLLRDKRISSMVRRNLLQAKTLAFMGYKHNRNAAAARLRPWHEAGVPTILSFTGFGRRRGIDKSVAWPVTDYVRGRAKWVA